MTDLYTPVAYSAIEKNENVARSIIKYVKDNEAALCASISPANVKVIDQFMPTDSTERDKTKALFSIEIEFDNMPFGHGDNSGQFTIIVKGQSGVRDNEGRPYEAVLLRLADNVAQLLNVARVKLYDFASNSASPEWVESVDGSDVFLAVQQQDPGMMRRPDEQSPSVVYWLMDYSVRIWRKRIVI